MMDNQYYKRRFVISGLAIGIVLVYTIRLFVLQVLDTTLHQQADNNALVRQTVYPSRGLIYDRNGKLLVFNQPIYDVMITRRDMREGFDTIAFCHALKIDKKNFEERLKVMSDRKKNKGYSSYTPQLFMGQLNKEDIALLQESLYRFSGVQIRKRTLRDYTYDAAAHVLGSVGEVNQDYIDADPYYDVGDYAGRDGIELTYEHTLRGQKGVEILLRDSRGRIQGKYQDGLADLPAKAGQDMTITIDIQLQMLAEELLTNKIGSVVAIEPATGEILALVSSPSWSPRLLVGKARSKNYNALLTDPSKPLLNRATQALYPPGSTFKLVQALICLQEKAITPKTSYICNGPSSLPIRCTHNHDNPVALVDAIEQSCNPYFWQAFRDMLQVDGYGEQNETFRKRYCLWRDEVLQFGLGQTFQATDIGNHMAGSVPTDAFYDRHYGKTGWKAITIRSLSIGQGELLVTPLQLANQTAAIANEGYFITPHLNKHDSMEVNKHQLSIDAKHFQVVKEGMHHVMRYGTGRYFPIDSVETAGKTGTVQNPHGKDHAIFIGFAPLDNPRIAVAVVVENAGFGATWAAPIGSLLMEQYLKGEVKRQTLKKRIAEADLMQ